jgi:hypothetical protein
VFVFEKVIKSSIEPDWELESKSVCNFSTGAWGCGNQFVGAVKSMLMWCYEVFLGVVNIVL